MIAIIVEAKPKDKAIILLVETVGEISHVTRLRDFFNTKLTHFVISSFKGGKYIRKCLTREFEESEFADLNM
jgi:hypothetical protein